MAKRFSIKKFAAGVLALLMVVTALPVSGISSTTAKAADETAKVYRSYNPNNGEHLYTVDKSEHDYVVGLGYTDEGERFLVPTSSKTAIYRAYDPNSGEHLLVPKDEADWLAAQGWNNEGIKLYADDNKTAGVYRVYNPNEKSAGRHNYSNKEEADWLVAQGWQYDNEGKPVFYASELIDDTGLSIVSAEQASANSVKVTLSRELTAEDTIKVTRGTSEIAVSAKSNEGKVYTLTFASTLVKDTYKVVVTDKNKKSSEKSFSASAQELTKINWLSDTLNVSANTAAGMQEASTYVKGEDQWGNEMAIANATWSASLGTPTYNSQTGKLTLTTGTPGYTIGTSVTVICVVQDKAIAENHTYNIGMANSVAELTLGEMTTDNADYKSLPVITESALEDGAYYIPVTAKDENGVELGESDLTAMLGNTLFIAPDSTTNTGVLYFNGFTTKNGKPAMKISAGSACGVSGDPFDLVADMPGVISVLSTGAAGTTTKNITIYRDPVIKDMTITLPSDLYAGKTSEFSVSATDQYGQAVNLYKYEYSDGTSLVFIDGTTLTVSNATITATKDKTKKTITWEITPTGPSAGLLSITGTTAGLGSVIVNASYQGNRSIDSVTSLYPYLGTKIMTNAATQQMNAPVLSWNDGTALSASDMEDVTTTKTAGTAGHLQALMGPLKTGEIVIASDNNADNAYVADTSVGTSATSENVTLATLGTKDNAAAGTVTYGYAYTIDDTSVVKFVTTQNGNTAPTGTTAASGLHLRPVAAGTTTLTTHLYKLTTNTVQGTGGKIKVEEINTLKTDITVVAEKSGMYTLVAEKGASLYVGNTNDTINLTLTTASGAVANQNLLTANNVTFSCDDTEFDGVLALTAGAQPTAGATTAATSWGNSKTATVTVTATIPVDGDTEIVSTTFPVTNVAPKAEKILFKDGSSTDISNGANDTPYKSTDSFSAGSDVTIPANKLGVRLGDIYVIDQYGNDILKDDATAKIVVSAVNYKDKDNAGAEVTVALGTNKSLVVITDPNASDNGKKVAAGDTFQVIVACGSISRTFYITIGANA